MSVVELLKPKPVDYTEVSPNHARLVLEPLERGFGYTLGVALSGILLKTLSGTAVDAFQMAGVKDINSSKADLEETLFDVVMNLKSLAISAQEPIKEPVWLTIERRMKVKFMLLISFALKIFLLLTLKPVFAL